MALQRLLIEGLLTQLPANLIAAASTAAASRAARRWQRRKPGEQTTDQVTLIPPVGSSEND